MVAEKLDLMLFILLFTWDNDITRRVMLDHLHSHAILENTAVYIVEKAIVCIRPFLAFIGLVSPLIDLLLDNGSS